MVMFNQKGNETSHQASLPCNIIGSSQRVMVNTETHPEHSVTSGDIWPPQQSENRQLCSDSLTQVQLHRRLLGSSAPQDIDGGDNPHYGLEDKIIVGSMNNAAKISGAQNCNHPQLPLVGFQDLWYLHYSTQLYLAYRQRHINHTQAKLEMLVRFNECCNRLQGFWVAFFSNSTCKATHALRTGFAIDVLHASSMTSRLSP